MTNPITRDQLRHRDQYTLQYFKNVDRKDLVPQEEETLIVFEAMLNLGLSADNDSLIPSYITSVSVLDEFPDDVVMKNDGDFIRYEYDRLRSTYSDYSKTFDEFLRDYKDGFLKGSGFGTGGSNKKPKYVYPPSKIFLDAEFDVSKRKNPYEQLSLNFDFEEPEEEIREDEIHLYGVSFGGQGGHLGKDIIFKVTCNRKDFYKSSMFLFGMLNSISLFRYRSYKVSKAIDESILSNDLYTLKFALYLAENFTDYKDYPHETIFMERARSQSGQKYRFLAKRLDDNLKVWQKLLDSKFHNRVVTQYAFQTHLYWRDPMTRRVYIDSNNLLQVPLEFKNGIALAVKPFAISENTFGRYGAQSGAEPKQKLTGSDWFTKSFNRKGTSQVEWIVFDTIPDREYSYYKSRVHQIDPAKIEENRYNDGTSYIYSYQGTYKVEKKLFDVISQKHIIDGIRKGERSSPTHEDFVEYEKRKK